MNIADEPEGLLKDLAEEIRRAEIQVVDLQAAFLLRVLAFERFPEPNVTEALSAREAMVAVGGQLSGLRTAWRIVTGVQWPSEHPLTDDEDQAPVKQPRGDHPHTDPGDGRTECSVCGKWVWPVTHSCKGVPVTEAARMRVEADHP